MTKLAGFPPELLHRIFDQVHDSKSLCNVCLAGNHTLLNAARLLTFEELHLEWNGDLLEYNNDDVYQASFREFCADPARVKAVRCIRLTVYGSFDWAARIFSELLPAKLPNFTNVTHASLSFYAAMWEPCRPSLTVRMIAESIPGLLSLWVGGCECDDEDLQGMETLPTLRHLALWYNSADLVDLWANAPNVEVLELRAGNGEEYWRDVIEGKGEWGECDGTVAGVGSLLDQTVLVNNLVRLSVHCECDIEQDLCRDGAGLANVFEDEIVFPRLEELIFNVAFTADEYHTVMDSLSAPKLRRFWADTQEGHLHKLSFEKFPLLEDLWLPTNGSSSNKILHNIDLANNPRLRRLYFGEPFDSSNLDFPDLARKYLEGYPQLDSVTWHATTVFYAERDASGGVSGVRQGEWQKSSWISSLKGIGEWRDFK